MSVDFRFAFGCCLFFAMVFVASDAQADDAPLQPWRENPWYWSYHGQPVMLMGGSDDDNLFQWPQQQLIPQLDRISAAGGNVIRNTMSDRKDRGFEVYPFRQLDSGKYDLEQWNPEYWQRFERMLEETRKRQIVVQIEVWDRFDYSDNGGNPRWKNHPYNPANNINYTFEQSGFVSEYPDHPGANKQPFFFTTPAQRNNDVVMRYQQNFVDKLLAYTLRYDHVLYCMDNETRAEPAWGTYWARHIKERAVAAGRSVYVTEMWDDWNLQADSHKETFDHPELYDFVDVSQNNHNSGDKHWDNFLYVRKYLGKHPRPMNTTKTYGADRNKFGHTDQDGIERFWRHLLAGAASVRFHRPDSGLGISGKAVAAIRAARAVEQLVPFWQLQPANELIRDRRAGQCYLAADQARSLVAYLPKGGEVSIDLSFSSPATATNKATVHWINIDTGDEAATEEHPYTKTISIRSPSTNNWAAVISVD
ncbi:MAG: hypothetical protein R3E01_13175 [Pirellulaceae bacterium]